MNAETIATAAVNAGELIALALALHILRDLTGRVGRIEGIFMRDAFGGKPGR